MRLVAREAVPVVPLPERTRSAEEDVGFPSYEAFPRTDEPAERPACQRCQKDMHMIGHDRPSVQSIAHTVEQQQGFLHEERDGVHFQLTVTHAAVEPFLTQAFGPIRNSELL